jgi:tellurite resistance protein
MDLFEEVELDQTSADVIARGLCTVAEVDGMDRRERALIEQFWRETTRRTDLPLALEDREAISADDLAVALKRSPERRLFMKTAILVTWADGEVTREERESLQQFASALGFDRDTMDMLEHAVRDYINHAVTIRK